jgi:hypothetical protein
MRCQRSLSLWTYRASKRRCSLESQRLMWSQQWRKGQRVRIEIERQTGTLADGVWVTAPRMDEVAEGGVYGPGL